MTLEELQLRVKAAFPDGNMTVDETMESVRVELSEPLDLGVGSEPVVAFDSWHEPYHHQRPGSVIFIGPEFLDDEEHIASKGDWLLAEPEIERRLLSVSAHDIIAARRRLALADAQ